MSGIQKYIFTVYDSMFERTEEFAVRSSSMVIAKMKAHRYIAGYLGGSDYDGRFAITKITVTG